MLWFLGGDRVFTVSCVTEYPSCVTGFTYSYLGAVILRFYWATVCRVAVVNAGCWGEADAWYQLIDGNFFHGLRVRARLVCASRLLGLKPGFYLGARFTRVACASSANATWDTKMLSYLEPCWARMRVVRYAHGARVHGALGREFCNYVARFQLDFSYEKEQKKRKSRGSWCLDWLSRL